MQGDELTVNNLHSITRINKLKVLNKTNNINFDVEHSLSKRQIEMILAGGLINVVKNKINVN